MKRFFKVLLGLGLLLFGVVVCVILWINRPIAESSEDKKIAVVVEVMPVSFESRRFELPSQGLIEAKRRTSLAAEVPGKVIEVSPRFEVGREVAADELLVKLDPVDYETAIAQAESSLADARSALASEQARAEQALRDWRKLGKGGTPPELVAREPQLESATARVSSAEAALVKAQQDLRRTEIRAPFRAVISSKLTEEGQYLNPGTLVSEIFATSPYEIRLPLSVDEAAFLETDKDGNWTGSATLRATAAGQSRDWQATIVRGEGEIDRATRSLYLVAEVKTDAPHNSGAALRPGLFVEASITSREVPDVAAIPFRAFRGVSDATEVVVVDRENRIRFRSVEVVFREDGTVYTTGSFAPGDRICLTELPDLIEGLEVEPVEFDSPAPIEPPSEEPPFFDTGSGQD